MSKTKTDANKDDIDKKITELLAKKPSEITEIELKVMNIAIKWMAVKAKLDDESWGEALRGGTDED